MTVARRTKRTTPNGPSASPVPNAASQLERSDGRPLGRSKLGPRRQPVAQLGLEHCSVPPRRPVPPSRFAARPPRPLEPILVPKLRIHFADFPYLHCSIDQRLFTSETCCGYGYDVAPDSTEVPPWGFQGPATGLGTLREPQSFAEISLLHPLSGRTPSRLPATLQRKENSSPA